MQLDDSLSTTSQKAVKNAVITAAINVINRKLLPEGGATGAVLVKSSAADFST
jgi:hypothetical protein